jgi:hypothetical protein
MQENLKAGYHCPWALIKKLVLELSFVIIKEDRRYWLSPSVGDQLLAIFLMLSMIASHSKFFQAV